MLPTVAFTVFVNLVTLLSVVVSETVSVVVSVVDSLVVTVVVVSFLPEFVLPLNIIPPVIVLELESIVTFTSPVP